MASYRYEREIKPEDLVVEKPRELTPAEARANWWHYHWVYVALIAAAVLAVGYLIWQKVTTVEPDHFVTVIGTTNPDEGFLQQIEQTLTDLATDENSDGVVKVEVKGIWLDLRAAQEDADLRQLMESSQEKLNADFYLKQSILFIVDDPAALEQMYGCFRLLDGTDPQEGDLVSIEDFAVPLEQTALAGLQSESGAEWYAARRLTEGVGAEKLAAADVLWQKLLEP